MMSKRHLEDFTKPFLIINTVVSLLGTVAGVMVALGSVIGIADAGGPYAAAFLIAALFIPIAFLITSIVPWFTHARTSRKVTIAIVAFPWIYTIFFFIAAFTHLVKH